MPHPPDDNQDSETALRRGKMLAHLMVTAMLALACLASWAKEPDFGEVFDRHGVAMLLIDPQTGEIIDANPAAARLYGYEQPALRAMSIDRINTLNPEQIAEERLLAEQQGRNYFIFRHRLASGEVRTVEVHSHPFEFDGRRLLLSMIHDITPGRNLDHGLWHYQQRLEELVELRTREAQAQERAIVGLLVLGFALVTAIALALWVSIRRRERAEAALSARSDELESAIEAIDEAFVIYDKDDRLMMCNQKYREMYPSVAHMMRPGARFEDIVREWVARGAPDVADGNAEDWIARRMRLHRNGQMMIQHTDKDRWVRIVERTTPAGHIVGFRVDITELIKAREAAEAANVAKSRFLATMSHEIRTPLNGIMGMAQLMVSPESLPEREYRMYARTIYDSGQTLLNLLNDILDLSRIEAGGLTLEKGIVSPAELLAETRSLFSSLAQDRTLTLSARWQGAPHQRYKGDPHRLRQMLSNMVSNAIKFTNAGEIEIVARPVSEIEGRTLLEFSVSDTGIGISPENLGLLFRPFSQLDDSTTRRFGGTGLGLSIIDELARAMEGETGVESEPGKGSRFWFRVPLEPMAAPAESRDPEVAGPAPTGPGQAALACASSSAWKTPDRERVREHIEALTPLLEQSKFAALARFDALEALAAGTPLANDLARIRPALEAFRFSETKAGLSRILLQNNTEDRG